MIARVLRGASKGALVGLAFGAALQFPLAWLASNLPYGAYALLGALACVAAGQPPWRPGAWVGSIIKAIFGLTAGAGLYWLGHRFLAIPIGSVAGLQLGTTLSQSPLLFGPMVSSGLSLLIELDDGGAAPSEPTPRVRIDAVAGNGDDDLDEGNHSTPARRRVR